MSDRTDCVWQSLSVNRERLQLATEQRDITQLRQEAEKQAAEAKDRSRQLEQDIAKLQRQLASAARVGPGKKGGKGGGKKSWQRMSDKENDDARPSRKASGGGAGLSWDDDHAKTQQLLREQARFMDQLKTQRPAPVQQQRRSEPEPYSPEQYQQRRSQDSWVGDGGGGGDTSGVNRTLDYEEEQRARERQSAHSAADVSMSHANELPSEMSEMMGSTSMGACDSRSMMQQDPPSDPSSNDSTAYSFPTMVEVDVSTSSVVSERGGGGMPMVGPGSVGVPSPGEALRAGAASLLAP